MSGREGLLAGPRERKCPGEEGPSEAAVRCDNPPEESQEEHAQAEAQLLSHPIPFLHSLIWLHFKFKKCALRSEKIGVFVIIIKGQEKENLCQRY